MHPAYFTTGGTQENIESSTPAQSPVVPVPQDQPKPVVTVISQNAYYASGDLHVTGQVQNTGTSEAAFVKAIVTCYDANGNVVKVKSNYTQPDTLAPGAIASFEVTIYADQGVKISTYNVGVGM